MKRQSNVIHIPNMFEFVPELVLHTKISSWFRSYETVSFIVVLKILN